MMSRSHTLVMAGLAFFILGNISLPIEASALQISLKTSTGHYIVAEGGGGSVVRANRTQLLSWEVFTIVDLNGGALMHGDSIHLQTDNGRYVVAEGGGGREVKADRTSPAQWETFILEKVGEGDRQIVPGDKVALRTWDKKFYVSAEGGGNGPVNANRPAASTWETFELIAPVFRKETTRLDDGQWMETQATLNPDGVLVSKTKIWTTRKLEGFRGGVLIHCIDSSGTILQVTGFRTYGVDGEAIPGFAKSKREENNIDHCDKDQTRYLYIVHRYGKSDSLGVILDRVATVGKKIAGWFDEFNRAESQLPGPRAPMPFPSYITAGPTQETPANGTLVKGSSPEIYLIENGQKRWIPSMDIFNARGFQTQNIRILSDAAVASIPKGADVSQPAPGTTAGERMRK